MDVLRNPRELKRTWKRGRDAKQVVGIPYIVRDIGEGILRLWLVLNCEIGFLSLEKGDICLEQVASSVLLNKYPRLMGKGRSANNINQVL